MDEVTFLVVISFKFAITKKDILSIPTQAFEQYVIGFYNLENLFDVGNDKFILDDDFTPDGKKEWTQNRYQKKLDKLSDAISKIGFDYTGKMPSLLGVAEVENKKVLNDLVSQPKLKAGNYNYVHYNSPDERGIDVALLYDEKVFKVIHSQPLHIEITNLDGEPDRTRDILYVKGELSGMPVHIYVNHWPSRRDGPETTNYKRVAVAQQLVNHLNEIDPSDLRVKNDMAIQDATNVIILGDFNDDPHNESITEVLLPEGFDNVTAPLKKNHRGSLNHDFKWNLFDQILVSKSLHNDVENSLYFHKADIFDDIMLRQWSGKYRGQPARTFVGRKYKGGYSDHFPVFVILRKN